MHTKAHNLGAEAGFQAVFPNDIPIDRCWIAARTGFSNEFTHISERDSRASELVTSICAVLVAQACNTGTGPLERNDVPALRRSRLSWVNQNYIRNETLTAANACLVSAQNRIPLVHHWGGGEVASADGLRFVVPVRTVHAGPNPKYFGMGDGVTYYNLVSNQIHGTQRHSSSRHAARQLGATRRGAGTADRTQSN
jgi:Tn3 transposase DDE domain